MNDASAVSGMNPMNKMLTNTYSYCTIGLVADEYLQTINVTVCISI